MKNILLIALLLVAAQAFGQKRFECNFKINGQSADKYLPSKGVTDIDMPVRKVWNIQAGQTIALLPHDSQILQPFVVIDADSNGVDCDTLVFRRGNGNLWQLARLGRNNYRVQEIVNSLPVNRGNHLGKSDEFLRDRRFRNDPDSLADKAKKRRVKVRGKP